MSQIGHNCHFKQAISLCYDVLVKKIKTIQVLSIQAFFIFHLYKTIELEEDLF